MPLTTRTVTNHLARVPYQNGSRHVHWETPPGGQSVLIVEEIDPVYGRHLPDDKNLTRPPYHWHWRQMEHFTIRQGAMLFTMEGKSFRWTAADGVLDIPIGLRHTFKTDPDCQETVIFQITADPEEENGMSERFFRNIYAYIDDCDKAKVAPSLVQLLMFLDSAEVSLGLPGPRVIANPLSWVVGVVFGRYLGWLLG